jgi:hypothetical protein
MAGPQTGYPARMEIINRIMSAIVTIITAPFRAIAALLGRGGDRSV